MEEKQAWSWSCSAGLWKVPEGSGVCLTSSLPAGRVTCHFLLRVNQSDQYFPRCLHSSNASSASSSAAALRAEDRERWRHQLAARDPEWSWRRSELSQRKEVQVQPADVALTKYPQVPPATAAVPVLWVPVLWVLGPWVQGPWVQVLWVLGPWVLVLWVLGPWVPGPWAPVLWVPV